MTRGSRGFSLLEVLIAVLVVAIGLLGLAKMQALGVRNTHSAYLRSEATLLAADLADRVRANRGAYVDASGNVLDPPTGTASKSCEGAGVSPCTVTEMALSDITLWRAAVAQQLPGGVGTLCRDSTPDDGGDDDGDGTVAESEWACDGSGSLYVVKIWWIDDRDAAGNPVFQRFVTPFQP